MHPATRCHAAVAARRYPCSWLLRGEVSPRSGAALPQRSPSPAGKAVAPPAPCALPRPPGGRGAGGRAAPEGAESPPQSARPRLASAPALPHRHGRRPAGGPGASSACPGARPAGGCGKGEREPREGGAAPELGLRRAAGSGPLCAAACEGAGGKLGSVARKSLF